MGKMGVGSREVGGVALFCSGSVFWLVSIFWYGFHFPTVVLLGVLVPWPGEFKSSPQVCRGHSSCPFFGVR